MAAGLADDLLTVTLLATTAPVVVAPAMHTSMWEHAATVANLGVLRARGVHVVGPADGALTGGDSGPGRMVEPDEIVAAALAVAQGADAEGTGPRAGSSAGSEPRADRVADLAGLTVAVSAGGTREPIDPVRYLGNRSSGRQGAAVALAAADRGARVRLVAAHVDDGVLASACMASRSCAVVDTRSTVIERKGKAFKLSRRPGPWRAGARSRTRSAPALEKASSLGGRACESLAPCTSLDPMAQTPELQALESFRAENVTRAREEAIAKARAAGHTWREISHAVDITEQHLSKTYKHFPKGIQ